MMNKEITCRKHQRILAVLFTVFLMSGFVPALIHIPVVIRMLIALFLSLLQVWLCFKWCRPFKPYAIRTAAEVIMIAGAWYSGCDPSLSSIGAIFLCLGLTFAILILYSAFIGFSKVRKQKPKGYGQTRAERKLKSRK